MTFTLIDYTQFKDITWQETPEKIPNVLETSLFGFQILDNDTYQEYYLQIGDDILPNKIQILGKTTYFEKGFYFESAMGRTQLYLKNKQTHEIVTTCILNVIPSKIGLQNYRVMAEELHAFCHLLINDTIGKSTHAREWQFLKNRSLRSQDEELYFVKITWEKIQPLLHGILDSPSTRIQKRKKIQKITQIKSPNHQREIAKRGLDPRNPNQPKKCIVNALYESNDTPAHRLIKSFLNLLGQRIQECIRSMDNNIEKLQENKQYRKVSYETEDIPRIQKLNEHKEVAFYLYTEIKEELQKKFWHTVSRAIFLPSQEHFSSNIYYIHIAKIILRYLRSSYMWTPRQGAELKTKKSSRLYEQWVLLQLIFSFKKCGIELEDPENMINQFLNIYYGYDIPENTSIQAPLNDQYKIVIRYEPLIKYKYITEESETLCHYNSNVNDWWRPDITIELQYNNITTYLIVLDCKYSRQPHEQQVSNILKYRDIRSIHHTYPISKQLWMIYPGQEKECNNIILYTQGHRFHYSKGYTIFDGKKEIPLSGIENIWGSIIAKPYENQQYNIFVDFAEGTLRFFFKEIIRM